MTLCPRAGRWIGGCRFEARYDPAVTLRDLLGSDHGSIRNVPEGAVHGRVYVRDVCIRRGRTIERVPMENKR